LGLAAGFPREAKAGSSRDRVWAARAPFLPEVSIVKVLLAIDDSPSSRKAVEFVCSLFGKCPAVEAQITLFHVIESLPDFVARRSADQAAFRQVADEWEQSRVATGQRLLSEYTQALVAAGVPAARISARICRKEGRPESARVIAALAVIEEMKSGNYDVVVVGRRGTSSSIPSFTGGVAEKVAREAYGRTLWVVD